jgi:hypothetical protein
LCVRQKNANAVARLKHDVVVVKLEFPEPVDLNRATFLETSCDQIRYGLPSNHIGDHLLSPVWSNRRQLRESGVLVLASVFRGPWKVSQYLINELVKRVGSLGPRAMRLFGKTFRELLLIHCLQN